MKRREFIKVTAKGSVFGLASPLALDLLARPGAFAREMTRVSGEDLREVMNKVVARALANGGDYADVYLEEKLETGIKLVDGTVESVEYGIFRGGGVRVISDWKTGYSYCDSWEEDDLMEAAGVASRIASSGGKVEIKSRDPRNISTVTGYEVAPNEIPAGEKIEAVAYADKVARAYDPAIKQVKITYNDEMKRTFVVNSDGAWGEQEIPLIWVSMDTLARRGDKRHPGYVRRSEKRGFEYASMDFMEATAREAARQAIDMLDSQDAPRGEIPVVIGSGGGVVFHEAVGHGLEADGVEKGTSFFTGLVGSRVGSDLVTVIDDGSIPNYRGSYTYDDEGTPSRENVLIEGGILRGYMSDILTARRLNLELTGNGRRQSYKHFPLVRMSNTFVLPGSHSHDEIVAATASGLYAKHLGGGEVDTTTGNFTFGVREAYLIENGRITSPVRGATLMGNGPEVLKRIDMVGDDQAFWPGTCGKGQWVPVTAGAPTLRIAGITVGGRA
jgi:TldD protein